MTKIPISKKVLVLFLLWLRGSLRVILSIIMFLGFLGLGAVPVAMSLLEMDWTKVLVRLMISSFVLSFGSFLIIVYYDKLILRLS